MNKLARFSWLPFTFSLVASVVPGTERCPKERFEKRCYMNYVTMNLWCDHSNFTAIPRPADITAYAPPEYARKLFINGSCIAAITEGDMKEYPTLRVFDCSANVLKSVDLSAFKFCPKLETLHLADNWIGYLHRSNASTTDLHQLEELDLRGNRLATIKADVFDNLIALRVLRLDRNRLMHISEDLLTSNVNLRSLTLSRNRVSQWQRSDKMALLNLEELNFDYNHFTVISVFFLEGLTSLRTFSMKNNRLKAIASKSFIHSPKLGHIDLRNNHLRHLHHALFSNLCNLRHLLLGGNQLVTPQRSWFFMVAVNYEPESRAVMAEAVKGNPWTCDCNALQYLMFLEELENNTIPSQFGLSEHLSVNCSLQTTPTNKTITAADGMTYKCNHAKSARLVSSQCGSATIRKRSKTRSSERVILTKQQNQAPDLQAEPAMLFGALYLIIIAAIVVACAVIGTSLCLLKRNKIVKYTSGSSTKTLSNA